MGYKLEIIGITIIVKNISNFKFRRIANEFFQYTCWYSNCKSYFNEKLLVHTFVKIFIF